MTSWILASVFFVAASLAHAATGAGADDGAKESSVRQPRASDAPRKSGFDELSVSLGDETYLSRSIGPNNITSYQEISARVRGRKVGPIFTAALDAGASTAANVRNDSNFEVPEAYFLLHTPDSERLKSASLTVGRKKERWSDLDSEWSLGVVQPFNKFDALRPTEQGLTGAFAEGSAGLFSLTLFGSPIFIPEQTAPYELNAGRFNNSSPWFSTPPDQLILLNQTRSALYTVNVPDTASVVKHASYGFRARVSSPTADGFYAQGSYLRAPMNAINLAFTGQLRLGDTTYGDVQIYPQVVYHTITAGDVGYAAQTFALNFSVLHETPDQPELASDATTSHFSEMTLLSPGLEFQLVPTRVWSPKFRLAYLTTTGGDVTAVGVYANNGNVFGPRLNYRQALSGAVEMTIYRGAQFSIEGSARWIEELDELGSVVMSDLRLGIGDSWRFALQADFLGSRQSTSDTDTFIARYRANDRASIRLTYFF